MAIEIVDLPIKNGGSVHSYVSLLEGNAKKNFRNSWPWPNGGFLKLGYPMVNQDNQWLSMLKDGRIFDVFFGGTPITHHLPCGKLT